MTHDNAATATPFDPPSTGIRWPVSDRLPDSSCVSAFVVRCARH